MVWALLVVLDGAPCAEATGLCTVLSEMAVTRASILSVPRVILESTVEDDVVCDGRCANSYRAIVAVHASIVSARRQNVSIEKRTLSQGLG